jgi:RHS repeat-associated protein
VVGGVTSQYVYDGNGRRVKKIVGGVATRFEYGVGGELIAERNESNGALIKEYFYKGGELLATTTTGTTYEYATADHLGSPQAWTDNSGNLVAGGRHDYLPFGEELFAGHGVRTSDQGYATNTQADGQRKQFGSKERDNETSLDYFGARYFSSVQGRFTSPDDFLNDTHVSDPQSWNLYVYVRNNPLRYIDPTGEIKTNPDGSVTFDPDNVDKKTGKPKDSEFIYIRTVGEDGSITTTKWRAVKGSIYTDNGTKITAYKATTAVSAEVTNSLGFVDKAASDAKTAALSGSDNSSDCHGVTFAQGQVWIDNDQVKKIINNDGYRPLADNEAPQVGDVGIYAQGRKFDLGNTQHSVTVNSILNGQVQNVISKGGINRRRISPPGPGPGTAWNSADNLSDKRNTQLKYFTKRVQQ